MAELKNMTVKALRDLARKALGRGHSKLKTKSELIAALQAAEKKVSGAAEKAAARVKQAGDAAEKAAARVKDATGRAARAAEKMVRTAKGPAKKKPPSTAKKPKPPSAAPEAAPPPEPVAPAEAAPVEAGAPEPDPEGHFVARVRGEEALREAPHPLSESAAAPPPGKPARPPKGLRPEHAYDENLGELPWSYGDDAFVALPRDPKTLFLYWDHAGETLQQAWAGLEGGRAQIWVLARRIDGGWERVRTIDFALESRSYYVHDLDPGRIYRAEIHIVDRAGREKRLGAPSNELELPPVGASAVVDDRFMRLPWGEPLQQVLRRIRAGGPFPDELRAQFARLSDWSRFGVGAGGGSAGGGIGGRPGSAPTSPSSPAGPPGSRGEGR